MTIEITNKSGELVPTDGVRELLQRALVELKLNPECEVNLVFVDIEEMTELHIKWMDEGGLLPLGVGVLCWTLTRQRNRAHEVQGRGILQPRRTTTTRVRSYYRRRPRGRGRRSHAYEVSK